MRSNVVSLPAATPSEHLEALAEVSNFGRTDMGFPGQGSWTYRILKEASLTTELFRMSGAQSLPFGVDVVSLQPCLSYAARSQDRYISEEWDLTDGRWIFNAVLDGHLNEETVDFVTQRLPEAVKTSLRTTFAKCLSLQPNQVVEILRAAIQNIDDSITSQFLQLIPRNLDDIRRLEDPKIMTILHDTDHNIIARSFGGATLVLSLTDSRGNLWIANLGVLGHRRGRVWCGSQITSVHDLNNPEEVSRVMREHPREASAIKDNRMIGFLEPTRAVGDTWLKLPATYTSHVFKNANQPWISPKQLEHYAQRILTPPYVSNLPDVSHHVPEPPYFVLLVSDGVVSTERYNGMDATEMVECWVTITGNALNSRSTNPVNTALSLLQDILGGDDVHMVSRNLTVEMEERWMDDTTILVQKVWSA